MFASDVKTVVSERTQVTISCLLELMESR